MKIYKKLTEVAEISTGKLDSNAANDKGIYPYFTCGAEPLRIDEFAYDMDAILLAGNNAQGNFHCQRYRGKFNAYQRTYIITSKVGYDIDYIYYNLKINLSNFKRISQGSQTKFLTMDILDSFLIEDLPFNKQKEKIKILRLLDKKIKLNHRINDNLSNMAQDIYMHYFFKKSPNGKLNDIIFEADKSKIQVGDAKNCIGQYPFFTSGVSILTWNEYFVDGRYCFLNTGGNADVKFYVGKSAYSTDTWCIYTNNNMTDYLYLLLSTLKEELNKKYFQGTGLKHLQKDLLKNKDIYIPTETELYIFNNIIQPLFNSISKNIREIENLIGLRNFLLPLLMNGQATIE